PRSLLRAVQDGDEISLDATGGVYRGEDRVARGTWLTPALVARRLDEARSNLPAQVERFIDNTLQYAPQEKALVVEPLPLPPLRVPLQGRHVLVVVRGHNYRADLAALTSYIHEMKPVLIGVDGGADALREAGFPADIIVGDMDSVSDQALLEAVEVI